MKFGFDSKRISFEAGSKTWSTAFPTLDSDRTLVTVFGSPDHATISAAVADLRKAYPSSLIVGCSTSGEIHGGEVKDGSLSVGIARFAFTSLKSTVVSVADAAQSFEVGKQIASNLSGPDLRAIFLLSDGLNVNGSELIRGVNSALPEDVVVTGGLAGDGTRFQETWVLADGKISGKLVVAVGFYGKQFQIYHGSKGGWDKFGPERKVTKAQANVLYELDGEPALALYEKYLGEKASELPSSGLLFPLAIQPAGEEKVLVRTLLAIDRDAGTMTFAGDLPVGAKAQLMKANFDRLIDGAEQAAESAFENGALDGNGLTIAVSCVGRRLVLGDRTEDELDAISGIIDTEKSPLVGFYSYGELSPVANGQCDLHNQTMTLTVLSERALDADLLRKKLGAPKTPELKKPIAPPKPGVPALPSKPAAALPKPAAPQVSTDGAGKDAAGNQSTISGLTTHWDIKKQAWTHPLPDQDSPRTLVLAFGSPSAWEHREAFEALAKKYPNSHVVGCSGSGEISGTALLDDSVVVSVSQFENTELRSAFTRVASADGSFAAGQELARRLDAPDLQAVFILSEGLNVNGTELVRGVNSVVDDSVTVTGGLAGDGARFERTWIWAAGDMHTHAVAAIGFYGNHIVVSHGSQGGWDAFGPQRKVTKSEGNVVYELDGKPALALYKTYLGDKAKDLPASGLLFPLALLDAGDESRNVVRTLLAVDHDKQSLTFAGDVPEGAKVQLMKAHFDKLVDGAHKAAEAAKVSVSGTTLAVAVSCVGRRLVLGARTEEELEAVRDLVGEDAILTGFYSYGELSPVTDGKCDLHNQTMTLTVFAESPTPVRSTTRLIAKSPEEAFASTRCVFNLNTQMWSQPLPDVDSDRTLVLMFGAPEFRDSTEIFEKIRAKYPNSHIIGCSSSGEIAGTAVLDQSLSLTVSRFQHTPLRSASTKVASADKSFDAGKQIAETLNSSDLRAIFILSEGLGVNGTELVRGVNSVVGRGVVVTGGLAGDGARFEKTWVFSDGKLESGKVAAIGFYGSRLLVSHGSQGGWDSFGPERVASKTEGNVVYELDGKPALALYETYLGDKAKDLPSSGLLFPLALLDPTDRNKLVVRTLLAVDRDKQSLTFAGDIPTGSKVQLMKANFDRLVEGAENAADMAFMSEIKGASLAVAISCVGRRLVLGQRTEDELEAVQHRLGDEANITGFYSYGELSPVAGGQCDLHNQTMTLTVFSETTSAVKDANTAVDFDKTLARDASGFATSACVYDLEKKQWSPHLPARLDSPQTLVLVFGSPDAAEHSEGFADLRASFPHAQIVGCSGSGEIAGNMVVDGCLSVAFVRFTKTLLKTVRVEVKDANDSFEAGRKLAQGLKTDALRGVFILSEGLAVNGTELVRGVNSALPEDVVVTGGLAGDGTRFEKTWVYCDGELRRNTVVAVGFYGDHVRISHGSQGGWDSFGPVRTVTKSTNNVLHELDGTPALTLYKTYLGDKAKDLPASGLLFPLSIIDQGDGQQRNVVRTLLSVDHDAQTLTFAGDIPVGAHVQLMKAHFDKLIDGADAAAGMTALDDMNDNSLAIAVSCVGRRLVLGQRTEDELEAVMERLPKGATLAGFYSYGELSPIADGRCDLHNQTMTLTVIGESDAPRKKASKSAAPVVPAANVAAAAPKPAPSPAPAPAPKPPTQAPKPPTQAPKPTAAPTREAAVSAGPWQRAVIPVRSGDVATRFQVERSETDGVETVRLLGKLDEKFNGANFGRGLKGIVVMDLAEIHRVTSFGVREWLAMLKEAHGLDELYLVRCSEAISNQLATIRAFSGSAKVVSFFAPYICEHCSASFNALVDVQHDRDDLKANSPPSVECLRCHQQTRGLDEDPGTYFSFVDTNLDIPAFVRTQLEALPEYKTAEPVEKVVNEKGTFIRVNTALDDSVRWRRILDGVEGDASIDLEGSTESTGPGIAAFVQALSKYVHDATFTLNHVPINLLKACYKAELEVKFELVEVQGSLADGTSTKVVLHVPTLKNKLGGDALSVPNGDGLPVDVSGMLHELRYAAGVQADSKPLPVAATPQPAAPAPAAPAQAAPVATLGGIDKSWIVGGLIVVLLIVVVIKLNKSEPAPTQPTPTVVVAETSKPDVIPVEKPAEPKVASWTTSDGVRPAWADRPFMLENGKVVLVGEAAAGNQDDALDAARSKALFNLISALQADLRGADVYTLFANMPKPNEAEAVKAFQRQMGPMFAIQRVDQAFKPSDSGTTVVAKFELPADAFKQASDVYRRVVRTELADFATRFPTLPGPSDYDVVIVASRSSRVAAGDVVMSEAQQPIYTLDQLEQKANQNDYLRLVVNSNNVAKSVNLRVRK